MTLHLRAPAKINWTLEVLARREDGYHEIRSVMQTIDLCDELVLRRQEPAPGEAEATLQVTGGHAASGDDLTLAAARLLSEETGRPLPVSVHLYKQIPVAAGLGGGASDAAAVLRGLNTLYGLGLPPARLLELGARLGSDVPFFLVGGACLAQGRGERVTPLPDPPEAWLLLVAPPVTLEAKTRRMYEALDSEHFSGGGRTEEAVRAIEAGGRPEEVFNVFDGVAGLVFPGIAGYRRALEAAAGQPAHLAGAGPALFAVFPSREEAEAAASRLGPTDARVIVARTLGRGAGGLEG